MSYGRRAARRDENEVEIVEALRAVGASVAVMPNGDGFPDLLVGFREQDFKLEVKLPLGPRGGKRGGGSTRPGQGGDGTLTADQIEWWKEWRGAPPVIVRTPAEALAAIGARPTASSPQPALPGVGPRPGRALYRCAGCSLVFEDAEPVGHPDAVTFAPTHWIEGDETPWPLCAGLERAAVLVTLSSDRDVKPDNVPAAPARSPT